jgi:aryl carrier-like protein
MLYGKEEPPITFMDDNVLKEGLDSIYVLNLSIGMSYYQGGHHLVKIM